MGRYLIIGFFFFSSFLSFSQVNWMTIEEAFSANQNEPRFILIDMYTNWCGWCKKMDATTFKNPKVVEYLNTNYYAVKFNAETKDTVRFGGAEFVNKNLDRRGSPHQLARKLLDNRLSYPSFAVLGKDFQRISVVPGYHDAKGMLPILKYFGDEEFTRMSWEDYQKNKSN